MNCRILAWKYLLDPAADEHSYATVHIRVAAHHGFKKNTIS